MVRPKSVLPIYRKHRSGQARVTINGRDYYLGPYGSKASKTQYDRVIAEWLATDRSPTFGVVQVEVTIAMLMVDYLAFAKSYYGTGKASEWHRIKLALKPLKQLYATNLAHQFGPAEYKSVRQCVMDGQTCARTTINANMKRLVRMFKWAAAEGKLPASVYDTLKLIPGLRRGRTTVRETDPVKPVALEVVEATRKHLLPIMADMVQVQLLIGCRPGEICCLTPAMIDRSGDIWIACLGEHKTAHHGHQRHLYIGPQAQTILSPYLLRGADDCLFRPCDAVKQRRQRDSDNRSTPPSCGNRPGTNRKRFPKRIPGVSYDVTTYGRAIKRAAAKAGVSHWSPNQLRHTRGTEVRSKFGLDAAASILGHSEVAVTQVYAEQDRERALEVARKIG